MSASFTGGNFNAEVNAEDAENRKHSLTINGHRTSISIENWFWQQLGEIATENGISRSALVARIDHRRAKYVSLSAALRIVAARHFHNGSEWLE